MRRKLSIIILLAVALMAVAAPAFCWKFASFADSRGDTNGVNVAEMTAIVNRINAENVDFAIFQGDAVTGDPSDTVLGSMMDNWLSIMNTLNCPWYYCPGNHEVPASTSQAVLRSKVNMPLNGPIGDEEMAYSFDRQNAHFVSLNSDHYGLQHHVQLSWLAADLANTNQPFVFVMTHEPAYPTSSHIGTSLDAVPAERDSLWNTLTNNGVGVFFCGHEHLFQAAKQGSVYQCLNGSCGAPLVTGEPNTFGVYNYVIATVTGNSIHFDARNDTGGLLTSWDYTVPAVSSPALGGTASTQTPSITWSGATHDSYQVKVTQRNDPSVGAGNWDSGTVTHAATTTTSGPLMNYSVYYAFIRERNATGWGPWSRKAQDFVVNTTPNTAVVYVADALPASTGWAVYGANSFENGSGITSQAVRDGGNSAWQVADGSASSICTEKYPVADVSFDTGATLVARMRATGVSGANGYNLGISNSGIGGMYLALSTTDVKLVDAAGTVRGSYSLDGTSYHMYRLTVKNATLGSEATAAWRVSVDGTDVISWTGAGTDCGFDGFVAGHAGTAGTGMWYFDYIAGRSDGAFTQAAWYPVDSDQPIAASTPASAKTLGDGIYVNLTGVVSATFTDFFYLQEQDSTPYSGIRINKVGYLASLGKSVSVTGTMSTTSDGERCIEAATVVEGSAVAAKTVVMPNHSIGGTDLNYDPITKAGQKGVTNAFDMNSMGMLIRATGRVTYKGTDYFYIDDGSGVSDGSGNTGVKISAPGVTLPAVNDYVDITGISSCYKSSGNIFRLVRYVKGLPTKAFIAYNDCVWPSGQSIGANVTTYSIGSGFTGATSGHLIDAATGVDSGVTVTFTQSGTVVWQPDSVSGGSMPNAWTDAYNVFNGMVNIAGVVYYGSTGWWVDAQFTGLDPAGTYEFVTTANRNDATYTTRLTKYTLSGADSFVNLSTPGVIMNGTGNASSTFCSGYNTVNGYVARWGGIKPGTDGTFKVRAEVGAGGDAQKAYALSGFKLARSIFTAYNDCIWDPTQYKGTNVTTFGIGNNYTGPASGHLLDRATGADTGVIATLTQSGGVTWHPTGTGGNDTNVGTDAYAVFGQIANLQGVIFYGATGWWVDLEFTGLDPDGTYDFITSSNRGDATYTNRFTKYTLSGVDAFTNKSTTGVTVGDGGASSTICSGYNTVNGYVARWTGIRPGADGKFKIRAEVGAGGDATKAYAFDAYMLSQTR